MRSCKAFRMNDLVGEETDGGKGKKSSGESGSDLDGGHNGNCLPPPDCAGVLQICSEQPFDLERRVRKIYVCMDCNAGIGL